jgi:general secretion pathway protein G
MAGGTADDSACSGIGNDNTARTGANSPSASMASRGATDTSTYPGASSEPTAKGLAGFPSTATKAAPWPTPLAITPDKINRSVGPGPDPAATGAVAPRSRAHSTGLEISGVFTADGATTKTGLPTASPTCVQYHPDMGTPAQTTAVTIRQPIEFCSLNIAKESSHSDALFRHSSQSPALSFVTRNQICRSMARGFTLIELMVVLVIIGVLAALIVPNVLDRADDARVMAARTDVNNLNQALKLYKLDNQRLPTAEQGLQALITRPSIAPLPANWKAYLDKLPNDPWGRPYQYLNPGIKGEVDVMSLGADGQPGGEGRNADIGSWQ